MTKEELIEFLQENMTLSVTTERNYGLYDSDSSSTDIRIRIMIGETEITSDYFTVYK